MDDIPSLSVAEVAARLGQPDFFVYDNNGAGRYRRGHVPNANHLNAWNFAEADLPADKTATLVFYCTGPG